MQLIGRTHSRQLFSFVLFVLVYPLPRTDGAEPIRFVDVTEEAGLLEPLAGIMGHGGAWGDYDADGDPDLYVGGFSDRKDELYKPAAGPVINKLLRNRGDGTFEVVPDTPAAFYARTSGAVFADLDNNGTLELFVANNCKGKTGYKTDPQRLAQLRYSNLFRNDGGKLVDISSSSGACPQTLRTVRNIGVFDYNGDGLLDLLVLEDMFTSEPRSVLFRNQGNLRFEDVNDEVGLPADVFGLGLAVADLNEDGRPDFFVAHSNRLFLSTPGGKYYEPPELKQVFAWQPVKPRDNEDWPCGAAFGDLNRDGRLDLVLGIHHERARNRIYINGGLKNGVPQFKDVSRAVGMPAELSNKSPHAEIQDFDNDGLPDLYFSTAWLDDDGSITPLVFRNKGIKNGLPQFEPIRAIQDPEPKMVYFPAGPSADYDRDGRVDLCLINWFAGNHTRLLRNVSTENHWLDVLVVGKTFNRMGIGSQIKVYRAGQLGKADGLLGFQELTTDYGYASGQEAVCHFGLGDEEQVDLMITLPDGKQLEKPGIAANQRLTIEEP